MHPRLLLATTWRVLRQSRHDHRTLAIVLAVPLVLTFLLSQMFADDDHLLDRVLLQMLAVMPLILMFLLTAVGMVRERTSGTLERLMTTPLGQLDLVLGYAVAFGLLALVQVTLATLFSHYVLGMDVAGSLWLVELAAVVGGLLGVSMGLLAAAVSHGEFQAAQLMPATTIPQIVLCGLFGPREDMAQWLFWVSSVMPLTYVVEALEEVGAHTGGTAWFWGAWGIAVSCVAALLTLASITLRRRTV